SPNPRRQRLPALQRERPDPARARPGPGRDRVRRRHGRVELRHHSPGARDRSARDPHQGPTLAPLADPAGSPLGGYARGRGRGETAVGPPTASDPGRQGHPAGPARPGTAGGGRGPDPPSGERRRAPSVRKMSVEKPKFHRGPARRDVTDRTATP